MQHYTMDGLWDVGSRLNVAYGGVDLSEATIEGVVADNDDNNAFTHTVEAESEADAFRALGEELDAGTVWDCRKGKPRRVYSKPEDGDDK